MATGHFQEMCPRYHRHNVQSRLAYRGAHETLRCSGIWQPSKKICCYEEATMGELLQVSASADSCAEGGHGLSCFLQTCRVLRLIYYLWEKEVATESSSSR